MTAWPIPTMKITAMVLFEWPRDWSGSQPLWFVAYLLALVLAGIVGAMIFRIGRRGLAYLRPTLLFFGVARRLKIGLPEQLWLMRIARHQNLSSPLTLLLSTATLQYHAGRYAQQLPDFQAHRLEQRLSRLQTHLFGSPEPGR